MGTPTLKTSEGRSTPKPWATWIRFSSVRTRLILVEALVFALLWQAAQYAPAKAQDLHDSQVEIGYHEPKNSAFRRFYDHLKRRQVLEELRQFLSPLRLPRKVLVTTDECGANTVPYEPGKPIIVCYEYITQIENLAPADKTPTGISRENAIIGAFVQSVLHEVAHAVFDLLQIPVWGREHDAADNLAAFVMLTVRQGLGGQDVHWSSVVL